MASHTTPDSCELEAALPTALQEKQALTAAYGHDYTPQDESDLCHRRKMCSSRRILLAVLALLLVSLGLASAIPAHSWTSDPCDGHGGVDEMHVQDPRACEDSSFPCLLNAASSEALHEVLHRYFPNRFKDGIYQSDKTAMEAVHREDASLATSLVKIAKRQAGGNNTTTPATTTPQTTPNTSQATPTSPPTDGTTAAPTTQPTTTSGPDSTTPTTRGSTTPASTTPTSTTATTSRARSQRPVTSTFTSTASNGAVVVVTSTSFVDSDPTEATATNSGGTLQTNAAQPRSRNVAVEAFAGVVMGGLLLV